MKKELKKKWIEALESGKYIQNTGELKGKQKVFSNMLGWQDGEDTFCVLGVLCDVAGLKKVNNRFVSGNARLTKTLGRKVQKQLGLTNKQENELLKMNDGIGRPPHTFEQLADWIKENL